MAFCDEFCNISSITDHSQMNIHNDFIVLEKFLGNPLKNILVFDFDFFSISKNFISAVCMSYRINSIHTCGVQEINFTVKQLRRIYKKLK